MSAADHPADHPADEPMDTAAFRALVGRHPAGVCVVALTDDGGAPVGFTASSVVSVSSTPPVLAFCVSGRSSSWPALAVARSVAVSFLALDQAALAERFAARGVDRFADGGWSRLPGGEPVVDGAREWVRGTVLTRVPLGSSHLVAIAATDHGGHRPEAPPLAYRTGAWAEVRPLEG
ncbi:flavin oxidoreductase [Serinibacter arcticus]|uniref:Flavin oxidoreductase n=1 Tax=Serinibacter arcticus TaxID=1655435 RepID=A0A2U1ZWQ5_9MICO|nr:flavin reductase family protein [Serinibacter arcticus]PWD51415.1 flavin oxidoreductase [Serinibacter arcticus]